MKALVSSKVRKILMKNRSPENQQKKSLKMKKKMKKINR